MIYENTTGLIHLISSLVALVAGALNITTEKGTAIHRKVGYVYTLSLVVLIATAFMIYRLFGGFGIFHVAAIISAITLFGGIVPAIFRKPAKNWLTLHYSFMYWSVMGLYAAFVAEFLTRIFPLGGFFWIVGIATLAVMAIANIMFVKYKKRWQKIERTYKS